MVFIGVRRNLDVVMTAMCLLWPVILIGCESDDRPASDSSPAASSILAEEPPNPNSEGMQAPVVERIAQARAEVLADPNSASAWGRLGAVFEVHSLMGEAVTCYRRAEAIEGEDFRWPYFIGCSLMSSDPAESLSAFERAAELNPNHAPLLIRLGESLLMHDRIDEAEQRFSQGSQLDRNSAHAYLGLARVSQLKGDERQCLDHLWKARSLDDGIAEVHQLMAQVFAQTGDSESAKEATALASAIRTESAISDPVRDVLIEEGVSAAWWASRGRRQMEQGDAAGALASHLQAVEMEPDLAMHHFNVGSALHALRRGDEAAASFERAIALRTDYAEARYNLGMVRIGQRRFEDAVAEFEEAIRINPYFSDARENLAAVLISAGRIEEAVKHMEMVTEEKPQAANSHYNLAMGYKMAGRTDDAIRGLARAVELTPNHTPALSELGILLSLRGRAAEAVQPFRTLVEVEPTRAEHHNNLGIALSAAGRYGEAIVAFREGLAKQEDHVGMMQKLAWLLCTCPDERLRDPEEALRFAEKAGELSGNRNPRMLETLAAAQALAGQFEKALATVDLAIELAGDGSDVNRFVSRLENQRERYASGKALTEP